ncbi:hypothetical protein VNO80_11867 [Phaseolus coccineus]|uniref:PH domain-containing protein n=1 Tax=Phaseolus coccineus TaxID=3886 RepID=A0AAN9NB71_PHACN
MKVEGKWKERYLILLERNGALKVVGVGRYSCGCTVQTEQTKTAKIPMKIVSISGSSSNFEDNQDTLSPQLK